MERSILDEARQVHDRPRNEKLLILTGDFHHIRNDEDYQKAVAFLKQLFTEMDIDPAQGVFAIPGNHDVGNAAGMEQCFGADSEWKMHQESSVAWLKNHHNSEKQYDNYLRWRMESYVPYCRFLSELGIYPDDGPLAAAPHVRCWENKLNLFHLNTTLIADGLEKDQQRVDLKAATDEALWENVDHSLPALALGHNSFFDLNKDHQTELKAVFKRHRVCAYLCGDTHRVERDPDRQMIRLESGYSGGLQIPNVVGVKGAADESDTWSDFGLYWHEWNEKTGQVTLSLLSWEPKEDQSSFKSGEEDTYPMPRSDKTPTEPDRHPASDPAPDTALITHLRDLMDRTRTDHPSFKLMRPDKLDRRLFPHIRETKPLPAMGTTGEGQETCPVWDIIVQSWRAGRNRSIVLTGAGGIGKTVALLSPSGDEAQSVPALYVPLFELVDGDQVTGVEDYLKKRLRAFAGPFDALAQRHWAGKPSLLLLLDGVNELPARHRFTVVQSINDWAKDRPGVQLVAVSRPLDGMNLGQVLGGEPVSLELAPLERDTVRDYLNQFGREHPAEEDPIWEVLSLPLFLVLYVKTGILEGKTACGYPLAPKAVTGSGTLIWNYLQRELLRKRSGLWVLRCAVACEYLLPAVGYEMVKRHQFTIERKELKCVLQQTLPGLSGGLPQHLTTLFAEYDDKNDAPPCFDGMKWQSFLLHEIGLLTRYKGKIDTFTFIHQHFRDCFAGLYLVNAAEAETGLPELWRHSQPPLAMDYAAQLMEERTAGALWEATRTQQPTDRTALYVQLELQRRRRGGDFSHLDFSGMDLRGISLIRYGKGLFRNPAHTQGTKVDEAVFQGVGHSNGVNCVAALPDGRIISGSDDNTLRVWDSYTGDCLRVLKGHSGWVRCVAALPDGRIVSGSHDRTLRVWDLTRGESRVLKGHRNWVICVAVLPDGRIVSGSGDRTLRVWDLTCGDSRVLEGHSDWVRCVAALPDGRIVSGSDDRTLRVWDLTRGKSRPLEGHSDWVTCVAALPDGRIVSGSRDETLRVWDLTRGESRVLEGHCGGVNCVAALPDGRIVSGSDDSTLRVWDLTRGESRVLEGHCNPVNCVAALPDGRIVSGSDDHTLRLWSPEGGPALECLGRIRPQVHFFPPVSKNRWVSRTSDGTLRVWNPENGEARLLEGHGGRVNCVAALPDGRIVSGSRDRTLRVWDLTRGDSRVLSGHSDWVNCVASLPDGRIVSGSDDGTLRVWDLTRRESQVLEGHRDWVRCVAALPDGRIISGSRDRTLRVWDLTRRESRVLKGHSDWVNRVAVLLDGRIVSGSDDRTLRVWDLTRGESRVLSGHSGYVRCVAPLGGNRILSGSDDGTLRVWDADTGACLAVLPASEMDLTGMDLRQADWNSIAPKEREEMMNLLYYNGATIPEAEAQRIRRLLT